MTSLLRRLARTPIAALQRKNRDWVLSRGTTDVEVTDAAVTIVPQASGVSVRIRYSLGFPAGSGPCELMITCPLGPIRVAGASMQVGGSTIPAEFPIGRAARILSVAVPESVPERDAVLELETDRVDWSYFRSRPGVLHLPAMIPEVVGAAGRGRRMPTVEVEVRSTGLSVTGGLSDHESRLLHAVVGEATDDRHSLACGWQLMISGQLRQLVNRQQAERLVEGLDACAAFLAQFHEWIPRASLVALLRPSLPTPNSSYFHDQSPGVSIGFTEQQLRLACRGRLQAELGRKLAGLWWGGAVRLVGVRSVETQAALNLAIGAHTASMLGGEDEARQVMEDLRRLEAGNSLRQRTLEVASGESLRMVGALGRSFYTHLSDAEKRRELADLLRSNVGRWVAAEELAAVVV